MKTFRQRGRHKAHVVGPGSCKESAGDGGCTADGGTGFQWNREAPPFYPAWLHWEYSWAQLATLQNETIATLVESLKLAPAHGPGFAAGRTADPHLPPKPSQVDVGVQVDCDLRASEEEIGVPGGTWYGVDIGAEFRARLAAVAAVLWIRLAAVYSRAPLAIGGSLRAGRNVALHNFAVPFAPLRRAAYVSVQRAGRRRRKKAAVAVQRWPAPVRVYGRRCWSRTFWLVGLFFLVVFGATHNWELAERQKAPPSWLPLGDFILFDVLDANHDGLITLEEADEAGDLLTDEEFETLGAWDIDGDGAVSGAEFFAVGLVPSEERPARPESASECHGNLGESRSCQS